MAAAASLNETLLPTHQDSTPTRTTSTITSTAPPKPSPALIHLLASKTAAITGGTTGIGRAIALEFVRQGCNIAVNHLGLARDKEHLESLLEEAKRIKEEDALAGELVDVVGDVVNPETGTLLVETAVQKWGRLDVFVSNAGVCQFAEFLE